MKNKGLLIVIGILILYIIVNANMKDKNRNATSLETEVGSSVAQTVSKASSETSKSTSDKNDTTATSDVISEGNIQTTSIAEETKTINKPIKPNIKYRIIHTLTNKRYDGGVDYYVLIDPVNLSNGKFIDNIKSIIKYMVNTEGEKITIEFHDKIKSLNISYKQYGDMSSERTRTQEEDKIQERHLVAVFNGLLKTDIYLNTLYIFPSAFSDTNLVGKYVDTIEFDPLK